MFVRSVIIACTCSVVVWGRAGVCVHVSDFTTRASKSIHVFFTTRTRTHTETRSLAYPDRQQFIIFASPLQLISNSLRVH